MVRGSRRQATVSSQAGGHSKARAWRMWRATTVDPLSLLISLGRLPRGGAPLCHLDPAQVAPQGSTVPCPGTCSTRATRCLLHLILTLASPGRSTTAHRTACVPAVTGAEAGEGSWHPEPPPRNRRDRLGLSLCICQMGLTTHPLADHRQAHAGAAGLCLG